MKLKELNNLDEGLIGMALAAKYGFLNALAIKAGLVGAGLTTVAAANYAERYLKEWHYKKLTKKWEKENKIAQDIQKWKEKQELDQDTVNGLETQWKKEPDKKQVVTEGDVVKFTRML